METSSASDKGVERLRSDMETIQSAMGRGLPFGEADIRFSWAAAVTVPLYGLLYRLGLREGVGQLLAATPLLLVLIAYFGYMALKSRRKAGVEPARRREYGLTIPIVFIIGGGLYLLRIWAMRHGLEVRLYNGVVVMTLGLAMLGMALLPFTQAVGFRRCSCIFAGLMLMAVGWSMPNLSGPAQQVFLVVWAGSFFCVNSLMMMWFLRRPNDGVAVDASEQAVETTEDLGNAS